MYSVECARFQAGTGGVLHLAFVLEAEAPGLEHELLRIDSFELRWQQSARVDET